MEDKLIKTAAVKLADWLNRYAHREGKDYMRLVYGLEVYIMNITKAIFVFTVSLLTGMLAYTIAVLFGFNIIRRFAHGMHAKNSTSCTVNSTVLFVLIPYMLKNLVINNYVLLPVYAIVLLMLFIYAPADTASRPLVGQKKRKALKKKALLSGVLLMIGVLLIGDSTVKLMLTLGVIYEIFAILPISYKLFKKEYKNYVRYENMVGI